MLSAYMANKDVYENDLAYKLADIFIHPLCEKVLPVGVIDLSWDLVAELIQVLKAEVIEYEKELEVENHNKYYTFRRFILESDIERRNKLISEIRK